MVINAPALA